MGKFLSSVKFPALMILAVGLIIFHASPATANFEKKATGSYLLRQDDGFLQILTLARKGTVVSQNSGQFVGENRFGDQQGAWQKTDGKRKLVARALDFTFNTVTDTFTGFGRSTFTIEFAKGFDTLVGTVLVELFGPEQDPLDPQAIPIETFGPVAFEGQRISAQ